MNKQSNERFSKLIEYIESNLCEDIDYKKLSQILGVNEYTMHRIFLFVTNYTLAEYIRKRRLSMSALDLIEGKEKVIDIAIKYKYESSQAFSRAFKNMMGFIPSEINEHQKNIKFFPKYELIDEDITDEMNYYIEKDLEFSLYGVSIETAIEKCFIDAPKFWKKVDKDLKSKHTYGLLEYDKNLDVGNARYYIAEKEEFKNSKVLNIRKSNYLVFEFEFKSPKYLHDYCCKIYRTLILSGNYELEELPDIEEYLEDGSFKFYIPIK